MGRSVVKVIGLQRSGTNYLDGVVRRNFQDVHFVTHRVFWKHDLVENVSPEFPRGALVLLVHKSPYSWIESLCRNAKDLWKYHDLEAEGPQVMIRRGNYEGRQIPASVERLCDLYSRYHLGWMRWEHHLMPVRFERLIGDVEGLIAELVEAGLQRRPGHELDLEFEVNQSRRLSDDERTRLSDPTSIGLDEATIKAITRFIVPELWPTLGRKPLSDPLSESS